MIGAESKRSEFPTAAIIPIFNFCYLSLNSAPHGKRFSSLDYVSHMQCLAGSIFFLAYMGSFTLMVLLELF